MGVAHPIKTMLSDADTMAAVRKYKLELRIRGRGTIAGQRANEESSTRVWYVEDSNWEGTAFAYATPNEAVAEYLDNLISATPSEAPAVLESTQPPSQPQPQPPPQKA